jgi:hypothetical protein
MAKVRAKAGSSTMAGEHKFMGQYLRFTTGSVALVIINVSLDAALVWTLALHLLLSPYQPITSLYMAKARLNEAAYLAALLLHQLGALVMDKTKSAMGLSCI